MDEAKYAEAAFEGDMAVMSKSWLNKLASCTGYSEQEINEIAQKSESLYRTYSVQKRSGGSRLIAEPSKELKHIQTCLAQVVFFSYPVSRKAQAYEAGCSAAKNAEIHRKSKHFLHVDIKNFFPSIGEKHLQKLLENKYSKEDIGLIWRLVSFRGGLPIGAPSSPFLSNRVLYRADRKLKKAAKRMEYTRYADDMVFSGKKYIPMRFLEKVDAILREENFILNTKKTDFMGPGTRRKVTGVTVTDEKKLSAGTDYKKSLKKEIYNLLVLKRGKLSRVRGRLAYLKGLEPGYAEVLRKKYQRWDGAKQLWT